MSVRIDLEKKRKCLSCGYAEAGRIIFESLGDNTYFDMPIVGRPKVKGGSKTITGAAIPVQAYACLNCGHIDFSFEVIAPPEKPATTEPTTTASPTS
ncbi:MAG: hypothetical protein OK456_00710 [Thaumarchaeota archaeon]|nr:hypothetical protein [Nitrososphaerota archaeon]